MKSLTIMIFFLVFFCQDVFGQYNTYQELKYLLTSQGYAISTEQYQYLAQGESAGHTKTFYAGTEYVIVALSNSKSVKDVDVLLLDADGTVLTKDADNGLVAVIQYSPRVTRNMRAVMKNYRSLPGSHKCEMIIFYK